MWHESDVSDGRVLVRVVATTVAALLVLGLSAVPALGQDRGRGGAQFSAVCQNIIGEIGVTQSQYGNAAALAIGGGGGDSGGGGSARAVAQVAQAQGVSVAQVNECLNAADEGPGGDTTGEDGKVAADVIKGTIPDQKVLANTGGPVVLPLGLGLLLVASGASVLRVLLRR
jgi:hypothetical protein